MINSVLINMTYFGFGKKDEEENEPRIIEKTLGVVEGGPGIRVQPGMGMNPFFYVENPVDPLSDDQMEPRDSSDLNKNIIPISFDGSQYSGDIIIMKVG